MLWAEHLQVSCYNLLKLQVCNLLYLKQLYVHYMYPTVTRNPRLQMFTPLCNPLKKVITAKTTSPHLDPFSKRISLSACP